MQRCLQATRSLAERRELMGNNRQRKWWWLGEQGTRWLEVFRRGPGEERHNNQQAPANLCAFPARASLCVHEASVSVSPFITDVCVWKLHRFFAKGQGLLTASWETTEGSASKCGSLFLSYNFKRDGEEGSTCSHLYKFRL